MNTISIERCVSTDSIECCKCVCCVCSWCNRLHQHAIDTSTHACSEHTHAGSIVCVQSIASTIDCINTHTLAASIDPLSCACVCVCSCLSTVCVCVCVFIHAHTLHEHTHTHVHTLHERHTHVCSWIDRFSFILSRTWQRTAWTRTHTHTHTHTCSIDRSSCINT
jgi:hypothetical protein